jgi:N6-adenosine-specific RNA methylase IME4
LLHPIVVTMDRKLIVGRRRIEAFKYLGRSQIPARIAVNLNHLHLWLEAERDENTCRENYLPEEAVHLGRRLEEVFRKLAKDAQRKSPGRPKKGRVRHPSFSSKQDESKRTTAQVAAAVGMGRQWYERAKAVVDSRDRDLIAKMNRTRSVAGAWRILRAREQAALIEQEPPALPQGPFRVIVVDPPWQHINIGRNASPLYPTMNVDQIASIDVRSLAHTDCVLWLWTTNTDLPKAFGVAKAWGFQYKTMLTWGKQGPGVGDCLRGQTEHCLLCTRGKPVLLPFKGYSTLLLANKRRHSEKPEVFYQLVEDLCPGSKLEMFARKRREGWTVHGDEVREDPDRAT